MREFSGGQSDGGLEVVCELNIVFTLIEFIPLCGIIKSIINSI